MNTELLKQCEAKAQSWLAGNYNEETKEAVRRMLDNEDKTELIDAFSGVWYRRITRYNGSRLQQNEHIYCGSGYTRIGKLSEKTIPR